jgi:hypothetical protein
VPPADRDERFTTALQAIAILCLAGICSMIVHKGYADISVIAAKHSGGDFWLELARYALGNLAGGG